MSVYKRKGAKIWTIKVSVPNSKPIYASEKTKAKADITEKKIQKQLADGIQVVDPRKDSFAEYFDDWFFTYKETFLQPGTERLYKFTSKTLHQYFDIPFEKIDRKYFQTFMNSYGVGKGKSSVKRFRSHVRQALSSAIHDKLTDLDFTEDTTLVFTEKSKKPVDKFWDKKDTDRAIDHLILDGSEVTHSMIYTALQTGARFSEITGLRPESIDRVNRTISITNTWSESRQVYAPTKNEQSTRVIKVTNKLIEVLDNLTPIDGHLFASKRTGRPPSATSVNNHLKELEDSLGLKRITFHGLRHTHASLLLANGVLIQYISERLGHENVKTTIEIYAHLITEKYNMEEEKSLELLDTI